MKPRVAVLLAAYNGKEYILEQLFSLISQCGVEVDIYIRIDGGCNIFRSTVINLSCNHSNIIVIDGNVKSTPASNFYRLILDVNYSRYDFFAFSDQDDIWFPQKILSALSYFKGNMPQGVSSGVIAFYENGKTKLQSLGVANKYDYFFQAGGPGCTYILNNSGFVFLRDFLTAHQELVRVSAHDWLIYYIFRIHDFRWSFDEEPNIYYRQHLHNVAGLNKGFLAKFKRLHALLKGWYFSDLSLLIRFAASQGKLPFFRNPFNLRRSYLASLFIWLYYWCYFRVIVSLDENH